MQQLDAIGGQFRQVVRENRHPARGGDDGCPHTGFIDRQRRPHHEAVGVVEPDGAVIEAAKCGGARGLLNAVPAGIDVAADSHSAHETRGVLQRSATAQEKRFGAEPIADVGIERRFRAAARR